MFIVREARLDAAELKTKGSAGSALRINVKRCEKVIQTCKISCTP